MKYFLFSLFLLGTIAANSQSSNSDSILLPKQPVLILGGNLIDVETGNVRENSSLLIENGLIKKIGKNLKVPDNTTVIDAKGKWLLPGLIDSHIHLFQSGSIYTRPDGINLAKYRPYETERQWLRDNMGDLLRRYLACGITTVIDIGGPLYQFPYRDRFNKLYTSPQILMTGPLVSTYQPEAFKVDDSPIIKANTPEEARELVRRQLAYKPDFIKVWFIIRGMGKPGEEMIPIVQAAIDETHKNGLKLAIHTQELLAAKLGVKYGADFLVHSPEDGIIDDELIDLMRKNKVSYGPTMIVNRGITGFFSDDRKLTPYEFANANPYVLGTLFDFKHLPEPEIRKRYTSLLASPEFQARSIKRDSIKRVNLKKVWNAGINVVAGTDAGNPGTFHGTSFLDELKAMQGAGLSTADVLKSATINGAKIFGKEAQIGSLAEGKLANVLILKQNPLENIDALTSLETIVNRGFITTPEKIRPDSPENLAQKQLNAYNARNIDAFLEPYADDVEVYTFPDKLLYKGKEAMRKQYSGMFEKTRNLHCELVNRIVVGSTVIDHESVTFAADKEPVKAVAIYKVEAGKIAKVYFTR
ncbi:amidohydrolase family protein [Spirosoma endbachense]|uniref:Amidohydrolase family protein n=1 Tax=Spirosoma endbachense TaxID=2666025 RepID=A0A6P1W2E5_9BACT|nr:amidohydrolase family protein [Spirosoma endbachense]QHV98169.1 amidohydrolase family protein [Spirosoma endbachense]